MDAATVLGSLAGVLTTVSFLPQALKVRRSRRCDDLSWSMLLVFSAGVVCWLGYGVVIRATPVIVTNTITLALNLWIMYMKARYSGVGRA